MSSDYQFVSTNTEALLSNLIAAYEKITGQTMQPASPDRLFLLWMADVMVQLRVGINYAANQNIPSRAEEKNLDAVGELFYEKERPEAKAATCTMRFWISEAQSTSILIPVGTRVTDASSTHFWETTEDVYVPIGETFADATIRCQTPGAAGNGYAAGQLNTLVDPFSYYDHCENTTASDGGADRASDREYYEMMRASQDAYSTAGPMGAYVYWAKSVSKDIVDVKAICPKEAVKKTLPVYASHAFIGGDHLEAESLIVYLDSGTTPAVPGKDYTATYADALLTIEILGGGALAGATAIDISIECLKAGYVNIYALMKDGTIASDTIKGLIAGACSDGEVRPLTDYLNVEDPVTVPYDITVSYFIPTDTTLSAAEIQEAVAAAVADFEAWQCGKLGRDINPSKLNAMLMATGIKRAVITEPTFQKLGDGSDHTAPAVAAVRTVSITNGGYENE